MSNLVQQNIAEFDERDFRIAILEQSHSFANFSGSGVSPYYIQNQQELELERQLVNGMRENPRLVAAIQNNAPVAQVVLYLQGGWGIILGR